MSHYAKVEDGIVTRVIVAEAKFFDTYVDDSPGRWVQTYKDRSQRKNHAGLGYSYDATRDAFIPPQPYPSWTLNETTCLWDAPVTMPDDGKYYRWNEEKTSWNEVTE